jgi:hypothetical protein
MTISYCSAEMQENLYIPYNISEVPVIQTIDTGISQITTEIKTNNPLLKGIDFRSKAKIGSFYYLKYIFGINPSLSIDFFIGISIWLLIVFSILSLLYNTLLKEKLKSSLISGIIIALILANVNLIGVILNLLLKIVHNNLSKIILIVIILFTIFLETYFTFKSKKSLGLIK